MTSHDPQPLQFTEKQWDDLNYWVKLPDEARPLVERTASLYAFHKGGHDDFQSISAARKEIEILQNQISKLIQSFSNIGLRTHYALLDSIKDANWCDQYKIWQDRFQILEENHLHTSV
jgi:hypothetical protein